MNLKHNLIKTALAGAFALCSAAALADTPAYVTVTGDDASVHLLDANMNDVSSFELSYAQANGVAIGGATIYAGYFTNSTVEAYSLSGALQFSWTDSRLSGLSGLALVGSELVAASNGNAYFFNAATGAYDRSFATSDSTEGITYDGQYLWEIGNTLVAYDVGTGAMVRELSSPSLTCDFGGTGVATAGAGALMVACNGGDWYKVDSLTGNLISSGNNGLTMYDLGAQVATVPEPEAYALLLAGLGVLGGLARRRRRTA